MPSKPTLDETLRTKEVEKVQKVGIIKDTDLLKYFEEMKNGEKFTVREISIKTGVSSAKITALVRKLLSLGAVKCVGWGEVKYEEGITGATRLYEKVSSAPIRSLLGRQMILESKRPPEPEGPPLKISVFSKNSAKVIHYICEELPIGSRFTAADLRRKLHVRINWSTLERLERLGIIKIVNKNERPLVYEKVKSRKVIVKPGMNIAGTSAKIEYSAPSDNIKIRILEWWNKQPHGRKFTTEDLASELGIPYNPYVAAKISKMIKNLRGFFKLVQGWRERPDHRNVFMVYKEETQTLNNFLRE